MTTSDGGVTPSSTRSGSSSPDSGPHDVASGACIWLTGLSGSGKSTTANRLRELLEEAGRTVTLLDGDSVRQALSPRLGYSREERDEHIRRVGYVAAEVVRHGGIAVCSVISPYRATREDVRAMVGGDRFIEVFVDAPLAVCESRDPKGLYRRARAGEIASFTGLDDPYEPPESPDITLDTVSADADTNARRLLELLRSRGFVTEDARPTGRPFAVQIAPARPLRPVPGRHDRRGRDAAAAEGTGTIVPLPRRSSSLVPDLAPTRVYMVRHGTTLLNRQQRWRGRIDVPLDQGGWQDAWTAAAELGEVGVQAIYSSPLRRAKDTARVIADAAGVATVLELPGLVNLDYGDWEGLTPDEAAARHPDLFRRYQEFADDAECPGGERLLGAAERTLHSLHVLNLLHPGGTVVAVSHAVIVRLAIALVTDAPRAGWRRNLPNGSVTHFEVGPESIRLVSVPEAAAAAATRD